MSGTASALELYSGCLMARGVPGRALLPFEDPLPDEPESECVGSVGECLAIILPIKLLACTAGTEGSVVARASEGGVPTERDFPCSVVRWPGRGIAGADGRRASDNRRASSSAAAISFFRRSACDGSFTLVLVSS